MTLNQIINRIGTLVLAHKQIRRFKTGLAGDFFADHTAKYPAACLQYTVGNISTDQHVLTVNFRLILVDLVNVSADTKTNENDVISDMLSVILDLVAEINNGVYDDWRINASNSIEAIIEGENDLHAGWVIDFSLRTIFSQNRCQIPTNAINAILNDPDMKEVFDLQYISTGTEGSSLTLPQLQGKKILLIVRGGIVVYRVSSNPVDEYTWDNTTIVFGPSLGVGTKLLILYRNY